MNLSQLLLAFQITKPREGTFITCKNSKSLGRKIQISHHSDFSKKIERKSGERNGLNCTKEPLEIRLNKKDGLELFGTPLFKDSNLIKKELAVQILYI